jgi:hypothetical protein
MGEYRCPVCERPEGELHKGGCKYDLGFEVDWHDCDDERQEEFEHDQMLLKHRYRALRGRAVRILAHAEEKRGRFLRWRRGTVSVRDFDRLETIFDEMESVRERIY